MFKLIIYIIKVKIWISKYFRFFNMLYYLEYILLHYCSLTQYFCKPFFIPGTILFILYICSTNNNIIIFINFLVIIALIHYILLVIITDLLRKILFCRFKYHSSKTIIKFLTLSIILLIDLFTFYYVLSKTLFLSDLF